MDIKKTITLEFTNAKRIKCTAKQDMPEYGIVAGQRFHLVHMYGNEYAVKALTVTGRNNYKSGDVRFEVETNEGKGYAPTLRKNGDHSCSCAAKRGSCWHVEVVKFIENARLARLQAEKAEKQAQQATAVVPIAST